MINLNEVDPNWDLAQTHAKACKTGRPITKRVCPCCYNYVEREQCKMSDNAKSLDFLGFGIPLFYTFVKNCIILLIILAATYCSVGLIWAYQNNMNHCRQVSLHNSPQGQNPHILPQANEIEHNSILHRINHKRQRHAHYISLRKGHQFIEQLEQQFNPNLPHTNDQQQPHHLQCSQFFVKIARVQSNLTDQEIAIRLISLVVVILVILFNKERSRSLYNYFDQKNTTLSDYSIIITTEYRQQNFGAKIKEFFNSDCFSKNHSFQDIILLSEFEQIEQKEEVMRELNKQRGMLLQQEDRLKKLIQEGSHQHRELFTQVRQDLSKWDKTIRQHYQELISIARKSVELCKMDKDETGKAILILNTQRQKHQILTEFSDISSNVKNSYFGIGNHVTLEQAPQPKQILWQNIHKTPTKKFFSLALGFITSAVFIAIVTVIFYFILSYKTQLIQAYLENEEGKENHDNIALIIVIVALVLVILLNKFLLGYVLHKISHFQFHETQSSLEFSFCIKYAVCQFFTTALMTLAVEAIKFDNYYKHNYGVIEEETIMFLMTTFLVPLIWLINPFQLFVQYRRNKNYGKRGLTQNRANYIMSDFHYDIGKRYAEIIKIVWFTFLYCSLIPVGTILSIIGLGLYYWVDKYNLLHKSSINQMVSGKMNYLGQKLIDLCPLLKSLGQLIFDFQLRETYHWLTFVELGISLVFVLVPWNGLLQWIQGDVYELAQQKYEHKKKDFDLSNYRTYHPAYKILHEAQMTNKNKIILNAAVLNNKMEPRLRAENFGSSKNVFQTSSKLSNSSFRRQSQIEKQMRSNVDNSNQNIRIQPLGLPQRKVSLLNTSLKII